MQFTAAAQQGGISGAGIAGIIIGVVVAILAYWLPTIVAWRRGVPNVFQIGLLNFLAGWTMVGWVIAIVWAVKPVSQPVT
jgi:hypothetical protein